MAAAVMTVRSDLDFCPECGRLITDFDDDGREADDGQRWCRTHPSEAALLPEVRVPRFVPADARIVAS